MNNLKQVALAVVTFEDVNGKLPTGIFDANGNPLLSWRVQILPYLEQDSLFKQFHLDEPWDSGHNKALLEQMPDVFGAINGKSNILSFRGERPGSGTEIRDGRSNTILAVHVADEKAVNWTEPADLEPTAAAVLAAAPGSSILVVFYDTAAMAFSTSLDTDQLRRLIDHRDNEPVTLP